MTTITYAELLQALAEAERTGPVPVEGMSAAEWGEVWHVNSDIARTKIKQAQKQGLMRVVRAMRTNMIGRVCPTNVYQVVKKETRGGNKSKGRTD